MVLSTDISGPTLPLPGTLVVVGVGYEPGAHPQQGEGFDLQVGGRGGTNVRLVHSNVAVVLLVHVQVLDEAALHKVLPETEREMMMMRKEERDDDDEKEGER